MTADVNVTERVARALREPDYIGCSCCAESDGLDYGADDPRAEGIARLALAALSDPEVLAGVAGVLREHHGLVRAAYRDSSYGPGIVCRCGAVVDQALDETTQETQAHHEAAEVVKWLRGQG